VRLAKPLIPCSVLGLGFGLALLVGSSAVASPKTSTAPISKTQPKIQDIPKITDFGLKAAAEVSPAQLAAGGVTMDIINSASIRTSTNEVVMTDKTQLLARFTASPDVAYKVDCEFTLHSEVLALVQLEAGGFVDQRTHHVSDGRIVHRIAAAPGNRALKIFMQGNKNTNWTKCTIGPS
jgi:hypothetical protein